MSWVCVGRTTEIKSGEAAAFAVGTKAIAVFNVDGEFFATDDTCTHEEASLSEGFLEDHLVECPLHGSQFDLRTGEVHSLPATFPINTYSVRLDGDQIFVDV